MSNARRCDICERSETDLAAQAPHGTPALEIDGDGLWICFHCRSRLIPSQVQKTEAEGTEEIASLVGKSAGAICRTLNLPYVPPFNSIMDAASKIAYDEDLYMSAWSFAAQWPDGTSVWRSEDRGSLAIVAPDGSIRIESD